MVMDIKYYKDATDFLTNTGKYLTKDEVRYGSILGMAKGIERNPHLFAKKDLWYCSIGTGMLLHTVAMRLPLQAVFIAHLSGDKQAVAEKLVTAVVKSFKTIPGVSGEKELADMFAHLWCKKCSTKITYTMEQRLFRLEKVNNVPISPGKMRVATMADKELVVKWSHAFSIDVERGGSWNAPEPDITPRIAYGFVFLWEDDDPVSMAMIGAPTDKGMSINHVYTPPELRGKGYATSCVAELSRHILQSGKEFCILNTDLANPTSNSIYKKIGYVEVEDAVYHAFETPEKTV
jgi:predicted GNAT family acetyltransferase